MKLTKEEKAIQKRLVGAAKGITESIKRWNNLFDHGFARPESERAKRIMSRPSWQCYNHERIGIDRSGRVGMLWQDAQ